VRTAPGIYVRLAEPFDHAALPAPAAGQDPFAGLGKIAALGIKVSRHCAYHGLALNVAMDLEPFARINPCGYAGLPTVDLRSLGVTLSWEAAADGLTAELQRLLGRP
jgi:lipoyl(octanoyl) transferase